MPVCKGLSLSRQQADEIISSTQLILISMLPKTVFQNQRQNGVFYYILITIYVNKYNYDL